MCEHRDLLLYNSLQLLTVFNFIDENDQLKVMCEHRDLLLYNTRCSHITLSWSFSSIKLKTVSSCKLLYNNRSRCSHITLSWSFSSIKLKTVSVMCEHHDLLLYNSLQLLTVLNFIDENDQLKVICEHRDLFTHYFKLVVLVYKVKNSK
jgi:hypothetical protein